jgi:hypothetical protein
MTQSLASRRPAASWPLVLVGLFTAVFAVLALSGPGRIDIVDGQARYEVARSLVDHGDVVVRDPDLYFPVARGRGGLLYCAYRLPHSALGVPAVLLADATGPRGEARRHFYFLLTSAFAGAVLAVLYALWFAGHGHRPWAAVGWAAAGIFCTPSWFYSTTTFDDIFGTTSVVLAVLLAWNSRRHRSAGWALAAGLAVGLAFNCKQPLGLFVLPALAAAYDTGLGLRRQWPRLAAVVVGLAVGVAFCQAYEVYRFPEGLDPATIPSSPPVWGRSPLAAFVGLTVSPSAGLFWYCPTVLLSGYGLARAWRGEKLWTAAVLAAVLGFTSFLCLLSFFKGDIAWGPRYLTPVFGLLWLFAPLGAAALPAGRKPLLLALGFLVQLLALSTEPHRLYIEQGLPSAMFTVDPWVYCNPHIAHLLHRPREVWEVLTSTDRAEAFTPAPSPTYTLPLHDGLPASAVRKYHLFNSFRPWWLNQTYLAPGERPVDLPRTVALLLALAAAGTGLVALGLATRAGNRPPALPPHPCPPARQELGAR